MLKNIRARASLPRFNRWSTIDISRSSNYINKFAHSRSSINYIKCRSNGFIYQQEIKFYSVNRPIQLLSSGNFKPMFLIPKNLYLFKVNLPQEKEVIHVMN